MLVDNVILAIKAGNGGNGAVSFRRTGQTAKGGPDGGNGGNGGSVFFKGSHNLNDLSEFRFKKEIKAEDGIPGKKQKLYGRNGDDKVIQVPLGTQIKEIESGKTIEIEDEEPVLIAKGGIGGRGNTEFKSATNQVPKYAEKGTSGEEKKLELTLRLIADVGLIGLPNAGKSSLLTVLTKATPKIGAYPFTTIEPNIGMFGKYAIADIPGLIEGASKGKGLGISFLRHIEKTKIVIHCIDSTEENPKEVYKTVINEFKSYNPELLQKPEIVLFTKKDLEEENNLRRKAESFRKAGKTVLTCSIYNQETIDKIKEEIIAVLLNLKD